jgi:peptidoglycan/LPS O-acetylase OafA/YrhL
MGVRPADVNLGQGVSFFFVLSGFILAYVYPDLPNLSAITSFWRARIARIWPAHVASFLLGWWLLGYKIVPATAIAYLMLVQAWIPSWEFYFSYNAVAWSISTELFFYLCFPFLLQRWATTWRAKLGATALLLIGLIWACSVLDLPPLGPANSNDFQPSQHGVIYINPLSRLFEFAVGMAVAEIFRTRKYSLGKVAGTALEIGLLLLCVLNLFGATYAVAAVDEALPDTPFIQWLAHSSSVFSFAGLVFVMAQGRGHVTALLQLRPLVLLGEISFSMYLIHQILISYYSSHKASFTRLGGHSDLLVFFAVLIALSYLMWKCIEIPARAALSGSMRAIRPNIKRSLGPASAAIALSITLATVFTRPGSADFITEREAARITPAALVEHTGSVFGNRFELRGLDLRCVADGIEVELAWLSKIDQPFIYTNAVHLINRSGEILAQEDYRQPTRTPMVKTGQIWREQVFLPASKLQTSTTSIALALYRGTDLLPIDKGSTDWGGRRLVLPLPECKGP